MSDLDLQPCATNQPLPTGFLLTQPDRKLTLYEHNYIRAKNAVRRKALKAKLLEYNEDDVRSLPFILDAVANLSPAVDELAEIALRKDHAGRDEADGRSRVPASVF